MKIRDMHSLNEILTLAEQQWDLELAGIYIRRYGCYIRPDSSGVERLQKPFWIEERWVDVDKKFYDWCTWCGVWASASHLVDSIKHQKHMRRIYIPDPPPPPLP